MNEERRATGRDRREERRRWRDRPRRALQAAAVLGIALAIGSGVGAVVGVLVLPSIFENDGGASGSTTTPPTLTPTAVTSGPPPVEGALTLTSSGLGIIDIVEGTGAAADPGDLLSVEYTGWLSDGTEFGSSLKDGAPYEFVLGAGEVIEGWEEGLADMKVGGERRLIVPPELGYGAAGAGSVVPPNSQLTFDVKLVRVARPIEGTPAITPAATAVAETPAAETPEQP